MRIDWWTLGLQTVNLLVLMWLLGRFLFRPMARIVAERQEAADQLLADAEAKRVEADAAARTAAQAREAAVADRADKLKAAETEAAAARATLIEQARAEAHRIEDEAQQAIARMRADEQARANHDARLLAADIASKVLQGTAGGVPLTAFLERFEQALSGLDGDARARIGSDGQPLVITLARAPSDAESKALADSLRQALGRDVAFTTRVDPSLLGGLALETDMAAVDSSLRAGLDRVREGLDGHAAG